MKISEVIKSLPASNAAIKNTASSEPKDGWYPAYSASGQDVWLPGSRYTQKGIVVSAVGARCGKAFKVDGEWNICANTHPLSVDETKALRDYCWYMINNEDWWIKGGTAQPFIKVKDSFNRDFNFPSIPEQKLIVKRLDTVRTLIDRKRQQIEKLDELVKARFVEMFGDPSKGDKIKTDKRKIGEIATVTKLAGFEFTKYINYQEEGDIIMLRGLNCKNGHLVLDNIKWIDQAISDVLPRSKLYKGDILMTYAGTIGDIAMVDKDNTYHLAPNVGKISINNTNEINPVFLTQLFLNTHDYIMSFASQVAQASINMQKIRDFDYYFPPIDLQNQFATFVTQVDKSKFALVKSIKLLKKSPFNMLLGLL